MSIKFNGFGTMEQNEVWDVVIQYTKLIVEGECEKAIKYYHDKYRGWTTHGYLPSEKRDIRSEFKELEIHNIIGYNLSPVKVNVFNDLAIVLYFFSIEYFDEDGNKRSVRKRNTDVLIKQDNEWLLIADHSG